MVLVLKTSVGQLTAGSNPALSAMSCLLELSVADTLPGVCLNRLTVIK